MYNQSYTYCQCVFIVVIQWYDGVFCCGNGKMREWRLTFFFRGGVLGFGSERGGEIVKCEM